MKKSYIYASITIFIWSTIALVSDLLLQTMDSMQVLAISSLFAFLFLLMLNAIKGNLKILKKFKLRDYLILFGLGAMGIFLYYFLLYYGMELLQDPDKAFIINYLWPLATVLFACVILKEKFTALKGLAILLSFFGVMLTTTGGSLAMNNTQLIGALFCVLAATAYGLFSVLNKRCNYDNYIAMMFFYLATFLISGVYLLMRGEPISLTLWQGLGLAYNGICTYAIAYTLWAVALAFGDTAKISNLAYMTPFLSMVWTGLYYQRLPNLFSILGLICIVAGILIQNIKIKK